MFRAVFLALLYFIVAIQAQSVKSSIRSSLFSSSFASSIRSSIQSSIVSSIQSSIRSSVVSSIPKSSSLAVSSAVASSSIISSLPVSSSAVVSSARISSVIVSSAPVSSAAAPKSSSINGISSALPSSVAASPAVSAVIKSSSTADLNAAALVAAISSSSIQSASAAKALSSSISSSAKASAVSVSSTSSSASKSSSASTSASVVSAKQNTTSSASSTSKSSTSKSSSSYFPTGSLTSNITRPLVGGLPYGVGIYHCSVPNTIALTFSGGPASASTKQILDYLDQNPDVKVTFFVSTSPGKKSIDTDPDLTSLVQRAYNSNHQIGAYGTSHVNFDTLTEDQIKDQMYQNEMAIRNVIGVFPTYMRPPYSSCGPVCQGVLTNLGYHIIQMDLNTKDWAMTTADEMQQSMSWYQSNITNVANKAKKTSFLVQQDDSRALTASMLTPFEIVEGLKAGYKMVTVGDCLGDDKAYWYRSSNMTYPIYTAPPVTSTSTTKTSSSKTTTSSSSKVSTTYWPTGAVTANLTRLQVGGVAYGLGIYHCQDPGMVALTYNGGPSVDTTNLILDFLDQYAGSKVTFFVSTMRGKVAIDQSPELSAIIKRAYNAGHQIGGYGTTHVNFNTLTDDDIRYQMLANEMAIRNIIGVWPTYMRPPYRTCGTSCAAVLSDLGYHIVQMDINTRDWAATTPEAMQVSMDWYKNNITTSPTLTKNKRQSFIVQQDDTNYLTATMLTPFEIIQGLAEGFKMVTVGECLGDDPAFWYRGPQITYPNYTAPAVTTTTKTTTTKKSKVVRTSYFPTGSSTADIPRPELGSIPYGQNIYHCIEPNMIAVTYDDGPWMNTTELILDQLDAVGAHATFFVTAANSYKVAIDVLPYYSDLIRRMKAKGHQIAGHTWSHADLNAVNTTVIYNEMIKNEMALRNILGVIPTYMRPPFTHCNEPCMQIQKQLGYHVIQQDLNTKDWAMPDPAIFQNALDWYKSNVTAPDRPSNASFLVQQHDTQVLTANVLTPYEIMVALDNKYKMVTVGECFGDPEANWYRDASGNYDSDSGISHSISTVDLSTVGATASFIGTTTATGTNGVATVVVTKAEETGSAPPITAAQIAKPTDHE